jgi:hypothetical protein
MKNLLAVTTIVGIIGLGAAALAAATSPYQPPATPAHSTGSWSADLQGYTSNGPPVTQTYVSAENGFEWADAGIGVGGGLGAALVLIGGGLVVLRKRGRLAV